MENVDRCVCCGEIIPEGTMVCSCCIKKVMNNDERANASSSELNKIKLI